MKGIDLYILNQAVVDGQMVGVPYEYWQGKIATVTYKTEEGGYIIVSAFQQHKEQHILIGRDSRIITAYARPGYEFIGWSDGVTTPERIDRNVQGDFTVTAMFRKIED